MESKKCIIKMIWGAESGTWYAESDDIPGLVIGADTFDTLAERVCLIAPEMLECNLNYTGPIELIYSIVRVDYLAAVS